MFRLWLPAPTDSQAANEAFLLLFLLSLAGVHFYLIPLLFAGWTTMHFTSANEVVPAASIPLAELLLQAMAARFMLSCAPGILVLTSTFFAPRKLDHTKKALCTTMPDTAFA